MTKLENGDDIETVRHSLAHLLAAAVLKKYPGAKLGIGPVIGNGFYYDFLIANGHEPKNESSRIKEEDLKEFEDEMRSAIKANLEFRGEKVTPAKAKTLFKDQPFKLELIKDFVKEKKELTAYKTGDIFLDLCRGGHVNSTSEINPDAFKLTHIAGAYWRGSEKNPQIQRIYGVAFETKKELDEYLNNREKVKMPHITKNDLYEKSGHWEKFQDDLFKIKTREGHLFAMKPMNCPHHTQIYARKPWSYRELPQRYANTTMCYRDEQSGELNGLSRTRAFTQDDAHAFCRETQVKEEFIKVWDIIREFYAVFGFEPKKIRLSFHDPKHPEKYLGDKSRWKIAEDILESIAKEKGAETIESIGEAAFYGPKLDFIAHDSLGREWQVATIQLDMNMPERFDLTCINEKGEKERIVMIHAAIMGSIERFLAVILEHLNGAFPLWLSPVQARVIPVSERQVGYAKEVFETLRDAGIRAELDDSNETLGKRIRNAKTEKVSYVLVVGDEEIKSKTATLESRDKGKIGALTVEEIVHRLKEEISARAL